VLLYVLLSEGESPDIIWNIFFHFLLNNEDYATLEGYCQRLSECATSLETWRSSPYGSFLKISSSYTLSELRRHWTLYAEFASLPLERRHRLDEQLRRLQRQVLDKGETVLSGCRSAGIMWPKAAGPVDKLFRQYWETGTLTDVDQDTAGANRLNPTFAYSLAGEEFAPHYGTFPAQAFHLMAAFAPIVSEVTTQIPVMKCVQTQFRAWTLAFRDAVVERRIVVRFCVSDVLSFCHALERRSTPLVLDGDDMPTKFDVIDTSNLMDHLGMLNILIATKPLLRPQPTSVIYTEALLSAGKDASSSLMQRLCGDGPVVSLLLGLTPRALLSGFNTSCNLHELLMLGTGTRDGSRQKQFHERVVWCDPTAGESRVNDLPSLIFDTAELGGVLFALYDQLLQDERVFDLLQRPDIDVLRSIHHYNRATFARLVRLARPRIGMDEASWDSALGVFLKRVENDRGRLVGMNNMQDLLLQLHLYGIYTAPMLTPLWRDSVEDASPAIFRGWSHVPPVVCVVFSVPRARIDPLVQDELGSFPLLCNLTTNQGHSNAFACTLQAVSGKMVVASGCPAQVSIREDSRGVAHAEALVVSFLAPAAALTYSSMRIALAIQSTPATSFKFMAKLGLELVIFTTALNDQDHVHILPSRPGLPDELLVHYPKGFSFEDAVSPQLSNHTLSTMTKRVDLSKERLGEPIPASTAVVARQSSACCMELNVGEKRFYVSFPYPIKGKDHKLRVARKSLYVEVSHSYSFPVAMHDVLCRLSFPPFAHSLSMRGTCHIHFQSSARLDDLHPGTFTISR
jgi:hypothetical protein